MLDVHATLTLTGEGSIVFVQPFPIAHAMGQAIAPSLAGGFFGPACAVLGRAFITLAPWPAIAHFLVEGLQWSLPPACPEDPVAFPEIG